MPTAMQFKLLNLKLSNAHNRGFDQVLTVMDAGREMVPSFRLVPGLRLRGKWLARATECESDPFYRYNGPKRFKSCHKFVPPATGWAAGTLFAIVGYEVGFGAIWVYLVRRSRPFPNDCMLFRKGAASAAP